MRTASEAGPAEAGLYDALYGDVVGGVTTFVTMAYIVIVNPDILSGRGTGMRGVATRLAAFDGRMWVSSPAGGPTLITLEVPCDLSSPRTSPSSGSA